jgi:hypothetical protein
MARSQRIRRHHCEVFKGSIRIGLPADTQATVAQRISAPMGFQLGLFIRRRIGTSSIG